MFKEIITFKIFKNENLKNDHNTNIVLTEKELFIFGDEIFNGIYRNSYANLEIRLPNIDPLKDDVYKRLHKINVAEIANVQLTPGGIFRTSKLIINLKNKGRYVLRDYHKQYQEEFNVVHNYISDFLQNEKDNILRIEKIEKEYFEREQQKIKLEQERKTIKEKEYYSLLNGFDKIGITKILRTETNNDCTEAQLYVKDNMLLFEKNYSLLLNDNIESKISNLDEYLFYLDLNSVDCAYFILGDYFNKKAYDLSAKWNQYQNEYNALIATSNIQSTLKDFSTTPKFDTAGFIIGGLIGGTAGAILGGMIDSTTPEINHHTPAQTNLTIPQQYILKDYPQFVIRYRINNEYKHIILDNKNTTITKEQLLNLFGSKIVDSQTGENFYILESEKHNSQNNQTGNAYEEMKNLKELLDLGIITEEEFQLKKKQLLNI